MQRWHLLRRCGFGEIFGGSSCERFWAVHLMMDLKVLYTYWHWDMDDTILGFLASRLIDIGPPSLPE